MKALLLCRLSKENNRLKREIESIEESSGLEKKNVHSNENLINTYKQKLREKGKVVSISV